MEEELKALMAQNLAYTKQVHEDVLKIRKYILWQEIFGVVKVVVIVIPLILGFIYAAPLISQAISSYKEVMNSFSGVSTGNVSGGLIQQFLK